MYSVLSKYFCSINVKIEELRFRQVEEEYAREIGQIARSRSVSR